MKNDLIPEWENSFGNPLYTNAFTSACVECIHGYDENSDICAACLAGNDLSRHIRRNRLSRVESFDQDAYEEEWN